MSYCTRILDLSTILERKSVFLFGPRQTGKSSFVKNQLATGEFAKENDIALSWTLLDGRLRLKLLSDIGLLRQEVELRKSRKSLSFLTRYTF